MKYFIDLFIVVLSLPILLPLMLIIILMVKYNLGSPIFFLQQRPGLNGRSFRLVKFRTMYNVLGDNGLPLSDAERLTRFGSFLRASSLDELPELWNVLKGEMSMVGPRPLLMEYLPLYSDRQARRHEVRPGITGWAQVNGRNTISWEEKFELDVWYVDNQTIWLDTKILCLTLLRVFVRENISAFGHVTAPKFTGNKKNDN